MCQGRDKLEYYLADYKKRADTLVKKGNRNTLRRYEDCSGNVRQRL